MTMTGLRALPGAPNLAFNLVFPHVKSLKYIYVIIGSLFGQALQNYCFVEAGKLLYNMSSVQDALSPETTMKLGLISFVLLAPTVYKMCSKKKEEKLD